MGLFSSSKKSTSNVTNVTTETTTNIRDIGFTGAQAVDLAGLIEEGSIQREVLAYNTIQAVGDLARSSFESSIQAAGSAQQSALELQRQATSDAGEAASTLRQDSEGLPQQYLLIGLGILSISLLTRK